MRIAAAGAVWQPFGRLELAGEGFRFWLSAERATAAGKSAWLERRSGAVEVPYGQDFPLEAVATLL